MNKWIMSWEKKVKKLGLQQHNGSKWNCVFFNWYKVLISFVFDQWFEKAWPPLSIANIYSTIHCVRFVSAISPGQMEVIEDLSMNRTLPFQWDGISGRLLSNLPKHPHPRSFATKGISRSATIKCHMMFPCFMVGDGSKHVKTPYGGFLE